ncbi:MAG: thioredoxin-disulfide reductase [Proteobacteria bacterium]|nr:thioredoxin-disulfide reductase [Pseudomonadota bacterium]
MKKVIIYSKEFCPYCVNAKNLLSSKGVDFEEIRIDQEPAEKVVMVEKSNGQRTVPQIFIGDVHVGGCDDLYDLEEDGDLDDLLEIEKVDESVIHKKVIIIGSGPAGYTAAIYAARANLAPLIISGPQKGGQLTTTTEVDNYAGFPEGVDGNELMNLMEKQATRFGTEVIFGEISSVDLVAKPFKLFENQRSYTCDALIIATGASAKYLGLPSENLYKNRGVSACATCDGFFFKGQKVAVAGGGDTALEEAAYLTNFCEKVYLIHRRDEFRASKAMQQRVLANDKIEILWDTIIDEVLGNEQSGMDDLRVKNVKSGEMKNLGTKGLFIAIGHTPNTKIFKGILNMDASGYLITSGDSSRTNIPGVFACGDVMDSTYRQAITAAGSGCKSAIDAERWLAEQ